MSRKKFVCVKCQYELVYHTDIKVIESPKRCPQCNSSFTKEVEEEKE